MWRTVTWSPLALLQGVLNTFVIFLARIIGGIVDRAVFRNDREESGIGFFFTTMIAQFVLGHPGKYHRQLVFAAAGIPRRSRGC